VGGSGSGKSTILQLILRFHDPWRGAGSHRWPRRARVPVALASRTGGHRSSGFVPVPEDGGGEHRLRQGARDRSEIRAAAEAARAHEFIEQLPEGYDTLLDESGANLSGGQRQRIALARAFLRGAPILLMDEPTSGLDTVTESQLAETLEELTRGKTTITIAHRLSSIENADRILVLEEGRVAQEGTHRELIASEGLYRTLHDAQERTETDPVTP
jgi:ABC-type multidrug transport system fused ATPase/permease subunit